MCQITFSVNAGVKAVESQGYLSRVTYLLCATLATAVVTIGGLGSVQNVCSDLPAGIGAVDGFSATLSCKTVFRYYWFIIALEFVVVTAALLVVSYGKLAQARNALVGLFSVALLLWIYQSNTFVTLNSYDAITSDALWRDRVRTVVAGSIMTATLNAFNILALGYEADTQDSTVTIQQQ